MSGEKEYGAGVNDKCHFVEVDVDAIIEVCSVAKGKSSFEVEV